MAISQFHREQDRLINGLHGRRITHWSGVEMALIESGPDGLPVFEHPRVPFLQMSVLRLHFGPTTVDIVASDQVADAFGLSVENGLPELADAEGVFRHRSSLDLPLGPLSLNLQRTPSGLLERVDLQVSGVQLALVAGETHETENGIEFIRNDESVLVFAKPSEIETVPWRTPTP